MKVAIRGGGISAMGCAHLLARAGIGSEIAATARPAGPIVLLSTPARALMRDLLDRPALFADAPRGPFSLNRLATTAPAEPAPTTMKS